MHTYIHTYMHIYIQAYIHTYMYKPIFLVIQDQGWIYTNQNACLIYKSSF